MKYEAADRNVVAVATATICVAILLGTAGIPALQGAYYLDHGHLPDRWEVAEYWVKALPGLVGSFLGYKTFVLAYDIASGIVGTYNSFSVGDIVSGSSQVITTWHDIIFDAAEKLGASLPGWWAIFYAIIKFAAWV